MGYIEDEQMAHWEEMATGTSWEHGAIRNLVARLKALLSAPVKKTVVKTEPKVEELTPEKK